LRGRRILSHILFLGTPSRLGSSLAAALGSAPIEEAAMNAFRFCDANRAMIVLALSTIGAPAGAMSIDVPSDQPTLQAAVGAAALSPDVDNVITISVSLSSADASTVARPSPMIRRTMFGRGKSLVPAPHP